MRGPGRAPTFAAAYVRRVDALDLFARSLMAVGLLMALILWFLTVTGRYRPKRQPSPAQQATADRLQPIAVGMLGVATLIDLIAEGDGYWGVVLGTMTLIFWSQDRSRRGGFTVHPPGTSADG